MFHEGDRVVINPDSEYNSVIPSAFEDVTQVWTVTRGGNIHDEGMISVVNAEGKYEPGWFAGRFKAADAPAADAAAARTLTEADLPRGTRVVVKSNANQPAHYFPIGTVGVVDENSSNGTVKVRGENGALTSDGYPTNYVNFNDLALADETSPETLDEFRLRFLTAAVERGERNGSLHSAQVKDALDELARVEFLDPSKDLASFHQRIVDHAMSAKAKHGWCPEPEKFLRDLGLGHLLKVKKRVKVTFEVEVEHDPALSRTARGIARDLVRERMGDSALTVITSIVNV